MTDTRGGKRTTEVKLYGWKGSCDSARSLTVKEMTARSGV